MSKPPTAIAVTWTDDLLFRVDARGARTIAVDGDGKAALSPVELLAAATAACMSVDVVHILTRARQPIEGLRAAFTGERAQTEPHRFTTVRLEFTIEGRVGQAQVDRAVALSREKYCSVWNSLREDTRLEVVTHIAPGAGR
jgi:putative redox protein